MTAPVLRPHAEVIKELRDKQVQAYTLIEEMIALASEQGFYEDLYDIYILSKQLSNTCAFGRTKAEPQLRFRQFCLTLDKCMESTGIRVRDPHTETWVLCPRQHAQKHGFRVFTPFIPTQPRPEHGKALFAAFDLFHDGPDLVYAIGPAQ